jgi:hypothetical protein
MSTQHQNDIAELEQENRMLRARNERHESNIRTAHAATTAYDQQLALCDMFDSMGLRCSRIDGDGIGGAK